MADEATPSKAPSLDAIKETGQLTIGRAPIRDARRDRRRLDRSADRTDFQLIGLGNACFHTGSEGSRSALPKR